MSLFDGEDPPDAPLPAAQPVNVLRSTPSPWQGQEPPSYPEGHDPMTCEVCSPVLATEAWRRGVAGALAAAASSEVAKPVQAQLTDGA